MEIRVSFPLAFAAGAVSVLSACVLPLVPSYLAFVSGLTLDEVVEGSTRTARVGSIVHSVLFMAGFGAVFMTLGLVATGVGPPIAHALPWLNRAGGVAMCAFGVLLMGLPTPDWARALPESGRRRLGVALGSVAVGVAFGAGWTPCIGPVLGSVLLYTSREPTMVRGTLLLATYGLGLGVPFVAVSVGLNWLLAGSEAVRDRVRVLRGSAGVVLFAIGLTMVTGTFPRLTAFLAGLGQLINLELP